jgi:hypothetical protein
MCINIILLKYLNILTIIAKCHHLCKSMGKVRKGSFLSSSWLVLNKKGYITLYVNFKKDDNFVREAVKV